MRKAVAVAERDETLKIRARADGSIWAAQGMHAGPCVPAHKERFCQLQRLPVVDIVSSKSRPRHALLDALARAVPALRLRGTSGTETVAGLYRAP